MNDYMYYGDYDAEPTDNCGKDCPDKEGLWVPSALIISTGPWGDQLHFDACPVTRTITISSDTGTVEQFGVGEFALMADLLCRAASNV